MRREVSVYLWLGGQTSEHPIGATLAGDPIFPRSMEENTSSRGLPTASLIHLSVRDGLVLQCTDTSPKQNPTRKIGIVTAAGGFLASNSSNCRSYLGGAAAQAAGNLH